MKLTQAIRSIAVLLLIVFVPLVVTLADDSITDSTILDSNAIEAEPTHPQPLVYIMTIDGAIGVVTSDRISNAIETAESDSAELLLIKLDTPGGFTKPTWSIVKSILNSHVPVCIYIGPSGARAGSAGVYMTYSAHFAAMAPSTHIGAAHPVGGQGEEIDSVMNEKITNDAVAGIKASAEKRGRNKEWAEESVRASVSITDSEALELNVIDIRAANLAELFEQIHGRTTDLPSGEKQMYLIDPRTIEIEMTMAERLLKILSSPDIAFLLFSLGGLGLVMELYHPGAIFPGVTGAICLILAFYSFEVLPINLAGVGLILMAIVLFIAEIKVVSHGLLTLGGLVSLFFGGLMLIDTVDPDLRVSTSLLIGIVVIVGVLVGILAWLVLKTASRRPFIGNEGMIGKIARVRPNGFVYVDGALWKAEGTSEFSEGDEVEIFAVDKLTLKVKTIRSN